MKSISLFLLFLVSQTFLTAQSVTKNRVIILTDIEADPDDAQSLVRLLLYSNEIDIKGIVATTSCWQKTSVHPNSISAILSAYAKVQPNLKVHDKHFPEAASLQKIISQGRPEYGMAGVGQDKDSEGSELIIKALEERDDRPLWISVWGGVNTLAQALFKIKNTRTESEVNNLIAKLRVYTISDQDDSGIWIRNHFPALFYIVSPGDDYSTATWNAISNYIPGIDNTSISNSWIAQHIQQDHGPLGTAYPDVAWGVEGDTPSFLSLIPNGLNNPEHPNWGGWGGRYEKRKPDFSTQKKGSSGVPLEPETRPIWTDAAELYIPYIPKEYGRTLVQDTTVFEGNKVSLWRWRNDFQNDFAARMDWCIKPYKDTNHPPVVLLNHSNEITVTSGDYFSLEARKSYDPDGDHLQFLWFHYPEAGTYKTNIVINPPNQSKAYARAPFVNKQETAHFIVRVTDQGKPALTRYQRVILTIMPP